MVPGLGSRGEEGVGWFLVYPRVRRRGQGVGGLAALRVPVGSRGVVAEVRGGRAQQADGLPGGKGGKRDGGGRGELQVAGWGV